MPCRSDYMEATGLEVQISRVLCLLKEIKTGKPVDTGSNHWGGYHPDVYGKGLERKDADNLVAELCEKLSKTKNVAKYSLEMQMWWRDHQKADKARIKKEKTEAEEKALAKSVLKRLSAKEIAALKKHFA